MIPIIDRDRCNGCGACEESCPPRAITLKGEKAFINRKLCEECGECVKTCPEEAISIPER